MKINRPCPHCKSLNTLVLKNATITCTKENCSFNYRYKCPLCDGCLNDSCYHDDEQGMYFKCPTCKAKIHNKRIQTIFNNLMQISTEHRCKLCNGPTLYRSQANMGYRCFFFPKCSGQANLFSTKKQSLVFLDFETTGLDPTKDHIIEIGALKIDEDGFEHIYESFIKPPIPLPEKIIKITSISPDMLENAPNIEQIIKDFYDFLGDSTLVAHNADFDISWLLVNLERFQLNLQSNPVICTLNWAKKMSEAKCSLSALTKKYNIGHLNAHRALADAAVTKELFFIYDAQDDHEKHEKPIQHYIKIVDKLKNSSVSR
jgi:DNA polymerase III epsilon subunit family exonuclease